MTTLTRRQILRAAGGAAALAGLAACSTGGTTGPAAAAGPPRRGGTVRAAFVGGGASETLELYSGGTTLDFVRARAVHGLLGETDPRSPDGVRLGVLSAIEPAADLGSYTLRVRPDVRFTDGSRLTARDVAYSLGLLVRGRAASSFAAFIADFDLARARVVDDATLELPTVRPVADGREILCLGAGFVVKDGTRSFTPATPSCGPFRVSAFEPGRGTTLVRHDGWYGAPGGTPLDGLELLSISDPQAQLAAVRGGQADYAFGLSPTVARLAEADPRVTVSSTTAPSVTGLYFSMNMAQGPFTDPRLRQAVKLGTDREALVAAALSGRGVVGHDLLGPGFPDSADGPGPDALPPPAFDPDRARSLVAAAGSPEVALTTGPEAPGMVETATVLLDQLQRLGFRARLDLKPPGGLFADLGAFTRAQMVGLYSTPIPPTLYYQVSFTAGNLFAFGWNRPDVDAEVLRARTARNPAERRAAAIGAQRIQRDEGNVLVPAFTPLLAVSVPNLVGVRTGRLDQYPTFAEAGFA